MRFWDASAILPLLLDEDHSTVLQSELKGDGIQAVWVLAEVEIASALARRAREGVDAADLDKARSDLKWLAERWIEVDSIDLVRSRAIRLVNVHPLRAADALQLAAALVVSEEQPESLPFTCLDDRLREAARKEGFAVLPP